MRIKTTLSCKNSKITIIFLAFSFVFVVLSILGGINNYSPVPYMDMWDGTISFYLKSLSGKLSPWIAQHNEHRIIIPKIFFWMDLALFSGKGISLIIVNYSLLVVVILFFSILLWKKSFAETKFVTFFIICWLSSWIQHINLYLGFQNQFIIAQLLPLLSFYFLYKSIDSKGHFSVNYFVVALFCGISSAGTMANGVLVLPLMLLYSIIVKMRWRVGVLLFCFSAAIFFLYFNNYHSNPNHGSLLNALSQKPVAFIQYILVYLGGPFYHFSGKGDFGLFFAGITGLALIISSIYFAYKSMLDREKHHFELALLTFVLYIGGTVFGTAGGRVIFGIDQATSSRYMTPALMAWATLLILYLPLLNKAMKKRPKMVWLPFLIIICCMIPSQLKALNKPKGKLFEDKVAALAIELGIPDQRQILHIYPNAKHVLDIANKATNENISIFGLYPIKDARYRLGKSKNIKKYDVTEKKNNLGHLDEIYYISSGKKEFIRFKGWCFNKAGFKLPELIEVVDEKGVVIGVVLTGQPRPDVAKRVHKKAIYSGFKGYITDSASPGDRLWLLGVDSNFMCQVTVPDTLGNYVTTTKALSKITVTMDQVLPGNRWTGADFHKTHFEGKRVLGSYVKSDRDVGEIRLKLHKGDSIYYRTGPVHTAQIVTIQSNRPAEFTVPGAKDWVKMNFTGRKLPDEFIVQFSDQGNQWGEWSAIALINSHEIVK